MFIPETLVDFLFGTAYAGLVTLIALVGAIPYGIYQGIKRLFRSRRP